MYQWFKDILLRYQELDHLPSYQHLIAGGVSGAFGPMSNAPLDTIKTRVQRSPTVPGESGWTRFRNVTMTIYREEGFFAFYKGIKLSTYSYYTFLLYNIHHRWNSNKGLTPRLLRVAPGQAIT